MKKIRWGLVGTGRIAAAYGAVFSKVHNAELVAVADVRPEAATEFATRFECVAYGSHREMLEHVGVDAVLICTPPLWHEEVALDAMERGCHVLCEKPLSITLDSSVRMVDSSRRNGVVFTMASKFRYVEDMVRARALVSEGVIGDLILFENAFASRVPMHGRWNADPAISGGGVLIDNGTHSVDIMRYLVGPIEVVKVVPGRRVQKLDVEDTVHLFALTGERVMGNIDLSWSIDKPGESYVRLYGTEGAIEIGWKSSSYKRSSDSAWTTFGNGYDKNAAFSAQIEAFSAACLGQGDLRVNLTDALASVEVISAAYRAMQGSQWTPVRSHEPLREFVA